MPVGLEEITEEIYRDLDRMVLSIGEKLQWVFDNHRDVYDPWIDQCLPFGLDAARRMRMIWKASQSLPPAILNQLPRAWQAMYAVVRQPAEQLAEAIYNGELHPGLTVIEAKALGRRMAGKATREFTTADILVAKLVKQPVSSLGGEARALLAGWLGHDVDHQLAAAGA